MHIKFLMTQDGTTEEIHPIRAMYLSWLNDFISTENFAEHYRLPVYLAKKIIDKGRKIHEQETGGTLKKKKFSEGTLLRFKQNESGFCRTYFTLKGRLVCYQMAARGHYELLTCSQDGEPSHPIPNKFVKFNDFSKIEDAELIEWLMNNELTDR